MAIIGTPRRPQIYLSGPDGNAFAMLGYANKLAKELGKDGNPRRVAISAAWSAIKRG